MFKMDEIKNFINDLGITAFENNIKIAGLAVVSDSGTIVFQTDNWDLTNHGTNIINIIKGENLFVLNDLEFTVVDNTTEGIIATNNGGMGHVIFVPFQGGVLVSYAMPQADPPKALTFLKTYANELNGEV